MEPEIWKPAFRDALGRLLEQEVMVIALDRDGRILSFNPCAERIFGCREAEVLGTVYAERFLSDSVRAAVLEQRQHVLAGHEVRAYENEVLTCNGPRTVSWDAIALKSADGTTVGLVGVGRDVTARRVAERKLAESEARLRWLTDAMPGVAYLMTEEDERLRIPFVSEGIVGLMQVTPEEVRQDFRTILARIHPDDHARVRDSMLFAWRQGEAWSLDFRTVDGRWLRGQSLPRRQENGKAVWVGLLTDITPQKNLEARLQLASRLSALGTLAAGMAHELNNPLSYVTANLVYAVEAVGALPQNGELPEVMQALQDAVDGANRMRDIIGDLKNLARTDDTAEGLVELQPIWAQAIRMARHALAQRAQLTEVGTTSARVFGSPARLVQAFLSLLMHVGARLPREAISRHRVKLGMDRVGDEVRVFIEDNGEPIPEAHREHLFEPWFNSAPDVSGLGLTLCHSTVTALRGRMEVESGPGRTMFGVILPVA